MIILKIFACPKYSHTAQVVSSVMSLSQQEVEALAITDDTSTVNGCCAVVLLPVVLGSLANALGQCRHLTVEQEFFQTMIVLLPQLLASIKAAILRAAPTTVHLPPVQVCVSVMMKLTTRVQSLSIFSQNRHGTILTHEGFGSGKT